MERWEVFISYAARDADWPDSVVKQLADELRSRGIEVQLDVEYRRTLGYKPSDDQWRQWMSARLQAAALVLCLASKHYREAVERKADIHSGYGVAYESTRIIARLYRDKGHNQGRVWAIVPGNQAPAGTTRGEVLPAELDWQLPKYDWPTERAMLIEDLAGQFQQAQRAAGVRPDTPHASDPEQSGEPTELLHQHRWLVAKRLTVAKAFWMALCKDNFESNAPPTPALQAPAHFAAWLDDASSVQAEAVMFAARRALLALRNAAAKADILGDAESAAVALYLMAASRWIAPPNAAVFEGPVVPVPGAELLYCALLSVKLAGGALELKPSEQGAAPRAEYAFKVLLPSGEATVDLFERALYLAAFSDSESAIDIGLDDGPLSADHRRLLQRWLETKNRVERKAFTFVLTGTPAATLKRAAEASPLRDAINGRVFALAPELARALTGIHPQTLAADILLFWQELQHYPGHGPP